MRRRAFTLVELLVVLGVIMVLVGLTLTGLSGARKSAQSAACLSNLRQLAAAAADYAARNDMTYPPAQWYDPADPVLNRGWDYTRRGPEVIGPGLLWAGASSSPAVQQCPAFDGRSQSPGGPHTGYNYNTSYVGRGSGEGPPARVGAAKQPARTILFGDGQWALGANKYMRSPQRSPTEPSTYSDGSATRAAGTQGYRHRGMTNAVFCDGHAESIRERFTAGNAHVAEGTGFVSEDNSLYDLE